MTSLEIINRIFLQDADPDYPFSDPSWVCVAFERNFYDNTRMPNWFFIAASKFFNANGATELFVSGDCFLDSGLPSVCVVPFEWESYRRLMLRPDLYSVEYRMASSDLQCGCLADPDITVFGGVPSIMAALLDSLGGSSRLLEHMRQEFLLGDLASYKEMDQFFHRLLFPDQR